MAWRCGCLLTIHLVGGCAPLRCTGSSFFLPFNKIGGISVTWRCGSLLTIQLVGGCAPPCCAGSSFFVRRQWGRRLTWCGVCGCLLAIQLVAGVPHLCCVGFSLSVGCVLESDYECLTDAPWEAVGLTLDIWTFTSDVLEHGQLCAVPR